MTQQGQRNGGEKKRREGERGGWEIIDRKKGKRR
jgi:hypothetical protein